MGKTNIEWVLNPDGSQGYTWNPITGCLNHDNGLCKGGGFPCYAYKLAHTRLKERYCFNLNLAPQAKGSYEDTSQAPGTFRRWLTGDYADPFYPRFWEERLAEMTKRNDRLYYDGKKTEYPISRRGIFVCDMGDLLGKGVPVVWTEKVLDEIWGNKGYDRFYILTKQAARLPEFSPFPENAWVGVTAANNKAVIDAQFLAQIEAKVKYISFEPLLERIETSIIGAPSLPVNWLIIGACTGTRLEMSELINRYGLKYNTGLTMMQYGNKWTVQPKIEWVREIVEAADKAGVKVFLKDNLRPLLCNHPEFYDDIPQGDHPNCDSIAMLRQEMPE